MRQGLPGEVRPAQPGEEDALLAFFQREFPGRWRFEFQEHLRGGGRISDYLILLTDAGVEGFCQLTFEDSLRPLDRFFMHGLPRPWGQLGPIGVSKACRGRGYGAALLDAGLRRLRDAGVDGCVIDWTSLLDFYGKFGFRPYRQYEMLVKQVSPEKAQKSMTLTPVDPGTGCPALPWAASSRPRRSRYGRRRGRAVARLRLAGSRDAAAADAAGHRCSTWPR